MVDSSPGLAVRRELRLRPPTTAGELRFIKIYSQDYLLFLTYWSCTGRDNVAIHHIHGYYHNFRCRLQTPFLPMDTHLPYFTVRVSLPPPPSSSYRRTS